MVVLRPTLPEPMIAFLDHGDIGDAVLLGEVIGGGEAVAAAADDHHVVGGLGSGSRQIGFQLRLPVTALTRRLPSE